MSFAIVQILPNATAQPGMDGSHVKIGDCSDVVASSTYGALIESGVFKVLIGTQYQLVYCEMEDEFGGWTMIQSRVSAKINFLRNWTAYEQGFGELDGSFWIGNRNLYLLTSVKQYKLRVELNDWDGNFRWAEYSNFKIGDSSTKYNLTSVGTYSGDAGDSLTYHVGKKFSTVDQDNDSWSGNCALTYKGAWWYGACHQSNLNGEYKPTGIQTTYADGINWNTWKGYYYSYEVARMLIKAI